jgi:hypothetical protein
MQLRVALHACRREVAGAHAAASESRVRATASQATFAELRDMVRNSARSSEASLASVHRARFAVFHMARARGRQQADLACLSQHLETYGKLCAAERKIVAALDAVEERRSLLVHALKGRVEGSELEDLAEIAVAQSLLEPLHDRPQQTPCAGHCFPTPQDTRAAVEISIPEHVPLNSPRPMVPPSPSLAARYVSPEGAVVNLELMRDLSGNIDVTLHPGGPREDSNLRDHQGALEAELRRRGVSVGHLRITRRGAEREEAS